MVYVRGPSVLRAPWVRTRVWWHVSALTVSYWVASPPCKSVSSTCSSLSPPQPLATSDLLTGSRVLPFSSFLKEHLRWKSLEIYRKLQVWEEYKECPSTFDPVCLSLCSPPLHTYIDTEPNHVRVSYMHHEPYSRIIRICPHVSTGSDSRWEIAGKLLSHWKICPSPSPFCLSSRNLVLPHLPFLGSARVPCSVPLTSYYQMAHPQPVALQNCPVQLCSLCTA